MHILNTILSYLVVTLMLVLVFGVPVIIIRELNMRGKRTREKK